MAHNTHTLLGRLTDGILALMSITACITLSFSTCSFFENSVWWFHHPTMSMLINRERNFISNVGNTVGYREIGVLALHGLLATDSTTKDRDHQHNCLVRGSRGMWTRIPAHQGTYVFFSLLGYILGALCDSICVSMWLTVSSTHRYLEDSERTRNRSLKPHSVVLVCVWLVWIFRVVSPTRLTGCSPSPIFANKGQQYDHTGNCNKLPCPSPNSLKLITFILLLSG